MRLAWFTPLPPVRSGIAAYSAELLPRLAADFRIDVFVEDAAHVTASADLQRIGDESALRAPQPIAGVQVRGAHDFVWLHYRQPYDLIVYQMGNAACHDYTWPYLVRHPGLVVLHDGQLHHARARRLLQDGRRDDYRAEFAFNHPDAPADGAEFAIAGFRGALYYFWPMLRVVLSSARLVAVHNGWLAQTVREREGTPAIETIRMGVADPLASPPAVPSTTDRAQPSHSRRRPLSGVPEDAILFGAFGGVTPEKRIPQAIRALAAVGTEFPGARLLLVGDRVAHYDAAADAARAGVADRVIIAGYVPDDDVPAYLAETDICLCLRWPSSRETSASWLRCLAAAKPTIITDLAHMNDVPALDPRTWTVLDGRSATVDSVLSVGQTLPVCVSIEILDEDHMLQLAMTRLARDHRLRERLGRTARAHWEENHTLDGMADDYRRVIAHAMETTPALPRDLPAHLRDERTGLSRRLLEPFGVSCGLPEAF